MDAITIPNHHSKASGPLPSWAVDRPVGSYFSYFEGSSGDQWVFLATPESVKLAGGDAEWKTFEIKPTVELLGEWKRRRNSWCPVFMGPDELVWLDACRAASAKIMIHRLQESDKG